VTFNPELEDFVFNMFRCFPQLTTVPIFECSGVPMFSLATRTPISLLDGVIEKLFILYSIYGNEELHP